jgi:tetratricopeptide (TPR) repeat protein
MASDPKGIPECNDEGFDRTERAVILARPLRAQSDFAPKLRSMKSICLISVVFILGLAWPAFAQTAVSSADYRAAVSAYRKGDLPVAATLLENRSPESLRRAVRSLIAENDDWRVTGAAAMLHAELVISGQATSKADIAFHMGLALDAVENVRLSFAGPDPDRATELATFRERWYSLAASVFLASTDPENANQFVTRGLDVFKKSARLRTLAGEVYELRAHLRFADMHDRSIIAAMRPSPARQDLLIAINRYQAALDEDPSFGAARLRLGRTLAMVNRIEPAREALEAAAKAPGDPGVGYLAQLFLGALFSYQRDYVAARQAFQAALEAKPTCQTPYIALAFVERMTGHDDNARALFERFASWQSAPLEADPWWAYQNGGLDNDSLVWLRAKVVLP